MKSGHGRREKKAASEEEMRIQPWCVVWSGWVEVDGLKLGVVAERRIRRKIKGDLPPDKVEGSRRAEAKLHLIDTCEIIAEDERGRLLFNSGHELSY